MQVTYSDMKEIKGFERYSVDTDGKVYSSVTDRYLKQEESKKGYFYVRLMNNGKAKAMRIHRLVAMTYIDNPNKLPVVNHIDGNKHNNNLSNLEWCTFKQNQEHAMRIGLMDGMIGVNNTLSKLTEVDVRNIRSISKTQNGLSHRKLAVTYNVSKATIRNVIERITYKNIYP